METKYWKRVSSKKNMIWEWIKMKQCSSQDQIYVSMNVRHVNIINLEFTLKSFYQEIWTSAKQISEIYAFICKF